ncbi:glycosyltransferase family 39 protein [bacterium]|nr:glycosyltransferase family 39 protein [bacterium]
MRSCKRTCRADAVIFVLALVLRLAWVAHVQMRGGALFAPDAPSYHDLATNLASGRGLQKLDYGPLFGGQDASIVVRSFRPPLVPVVLSGLYLFAGPSPLAARLLMAFFGAALCVVVANIARLVFDGRTGLVAGLLTAVYPKFIYYSGAVVTETQCTLLLALAVWTLLRAWDCEHTSWRWLGAGALLGLAALTRSSLLAFPCAVVLWIAVVRRPLTRAAREAGMVICGLVVIMTPWWVHNWHFHGRFVPATTEGGYTLWVTNNDRADGGGNCFWPEDNTEFQGLTEGQIDQLFARKGREYIRQHPRRFLELACAKFVRFWRLWPHVEHVGVLTAVVAGVTFAPILLLAVWGALTSLGRWRPLLLFHLIVLYYTALHMVFMAITRYRVPMMPYLIIFASWGAVGLFHRRVPQPSET